MIIVAVVIIISFVFFGNGPSGGPSTGTPEDVAFTMDGEQYNYYDLSKFQRSFEIAQSLGLSTESDSWASQMVRISQRYQTTDQVPIDFAFNLVLLRNELKKFRIEVSDAEAKEAFKQLPVFQGENGFDGARAEFFQNQLGSMGFKLEDMYALLKDWLGFMKLQSLVAGNYVPSQTLAEQLYRSSYQTIKVSSIPFALEDFKKSVKVTDEEIQKYYDENKESYQSQPKRGVNYVFMAKPDVEKLSDEEKIKANNAYGEKVNRFAVAALEKPTEFEALAKAEGFEMKKVAAFEQGNPPAELKDEFSVVSAIFQINPEHTKISDAIQTEKGYYLFTVTENIEPQTLELAQVKDQVKDVLVTQKANESLSQAANDAKAKIETAVKAGEKFEDAAKKAGVKTQDLAEFSPSAPLSTLSNGGEIAVEARNTPVGQFTKPLRPTESGTLLVFVKSKELRKREDSKELRANIETSLSNYTKADIFRAWFESRRDASNLNADPVLQRMMAGA